MIVAIDSLLLNDHKNTGIAKRPLENSSLPARQEVAGQAKTSIAYAVVLL